MSLILLMDLDDTLLDNDVDVFLPAYIQAFSEFVSDLIEPDLFVRSLMAGTQHMVDNRLPDCNLLDVFESTFYPMTGLDKTGFEDRIDQFYAQVFPSLKEYTNTVPDAISFIDSARARGYRIVIATNPLFPRTAILQRLAWAGLPLDEYKFDLVASLETFHFTKPNPAFFAETLGRLGWPEGPVAVVGDDPKRDIAAAEQLGLAAFWIDHRNTGSTNDSDDPAVSGDMTKLMPWLDSKTNGELLPEFDTVSAILAILQSTPAVLDSLLREENEETWGERPRPEEWCPTEIVCHFRDVEGEVNLRRIRNVLMEDNPFLTGEDTDPWVDERTYICQNGAEALRDFTSTRMQLLEMLSNIQERDWKRPARHSIFGRTDLKELVGMIAGHDRMHIQQLVRDLG